MLKVTGGRPSLVRDFGVFLLDNPDILGRAAVPAFFQWRTQEFQYIADCLELVRVARRFPDVLERAIAPRGLSAVWHEKLFSAGCVAELLATGAVRREPDGRLRPSSPVIGARLRQLVRPEALATLTHRCGFPNIENTVSWKLMGKYGELASDAIGKALALEANPVLALQGLISFLARWDLEARIYVRDRDIWSLWCPFNRPDQVGPLDSWRQPEFARAAQTGQVVVEADGRACIPIVSHIGNTTMVVMLRQGKARARMGTHHIKIERVAGMLRCARPTLAQIVERIASRRDRQFQSKLWHRSTVNDVSTSRDDLLREVGCQAIIVLESRGAGRWIVSQFSRTGENDDSLRWTEVHNARRLDAIVRHPSGHGLVLSGDAAADAFPRLAERDTTLFLHPIRSDRIDTLIVFQFEGETRPLDSQMQSRLSVYAPEILKAA